MKKHTWAMSKTGEIVDVTPSEYKKQEEWIAKIFHYGMKYHIPTTLLMAFVSYINYKVFDKNKIFCFL